jgi:hypothetical protein
MNTTIQNATKYTTWGRRPLTTWGRENTWGFHRHTTWGR